MAMAMGRFLSQGLVGRNPTISISTRVLTQRHRSDKVHEAQLIEVDLDTSSSTTTTASSSSSSDGDADYAGGMRKLEEVIQNIIARRAAPDWLPFLPGYSYWVPPTNTKSHPGRFIEAVGEILAPPLPPPRLSRDETVSFPSTRGWPSSPYFIQGSPPSHQIPMELEVEVRIHGKSGDESSSEDEEG